MRWHEFIFSEEGTYKVMRHLAFWSSWWLFFLLCFFLYQQPIPFENIKPYYLSPGQHLPLKTFLLVLLFALACYPLIYYLFPAITKGKWLMGAACFVLICTCLAIASHVLYWTIFPFIDSHGAAGSNKRATIFWPAISLGLMNFAKVAAGAITIKYVKYWWKKQKESRWLEKEKLNAELQLLKAQVRPDFLFKTLNNIYTHALSSSPRTTGMLLTLSDLLSYMLYECDRPLVPLQREIDMMKEYMQLEKTRHNDTPEIQVSIRGNLEGKSIAPFLLLPFIENGFKHCGQMTEPFWMNMDIRMEGNEFSMKLANGISENLYDPETATSGLGNVQKRLSLLYPGNHELRVTTEQEMFIVFLNIRLNEDAATAIDREEWNAPITRNETATHH